MNELFTIVGVVGIVGMLYRISATLGEMSAQIKSLIISHDDHEIRIRTLESASDESRSR